MAGIKTQDILSIGSALLMIGALGMAACGDDGEEEAPTTGGGTGLVGSGGTSAGGSGGSGATFAGGSGAMAGSGAGAMPSGGTGGGSTGGPVAQENCPADGGFDTPADPDAADSLWIFSGLDSNATIDVNEEAGLGGAIFAITDKTDDPTLADPALQTVPAGLACSSENVLQMHTVESSTTNFGSIMGFNLSQEGDGPKMVFDASAYAGVEFYVAETQAGIQTPQVLLEIAGTNLAPPVEGGTCENNETNTKCFAYFGWSFRAPADGSWSKQTLCFADAKQPVWAMETPEEGLELDQLLGFQFKLAENHPETTFYVGRFRFLTTCE